MLVDIYVRMIKASTERIFENDLLTVFFFFLYVIQQKQQMSHLIFHLLMAHVIGVGIRLSTRFRFQLKRQQQ